VLDQGAGRTYPANTRYLTTPERYDESPDQTLFRISEVMTYFFFKSKELMGVPGVH
jgi:hypothetical protein